MVSGTVYFRSCAHGTLPRKISSLEHRGCDESHIPDAEVIERFGWESSDIFRELPKSIQRVLIYRQETRFASIAAELLAQGSSVRLHSLL
jgi:hypothetical protein